MIEKILFLDHHLGAKEPMLCYAVGEVVDENDQSIVLQYWGCIGEDVDDSNNEYVTIVKSTVVTRLSVTTVAPKGP
jgi:hypothetical protein